MSQVPPPLTLVPDSVDPSPDPPTPDTEEIHAMTGESGSYEYVHPVTISRMHPDTRDLHKTNRMHCYISGRCGIIEVQR